LLLSGLAQLPPFPGGPTPGRAAHMRRPIPLPHAPPDRCPPPLLSWAVGIGALPPPRLMPRPARPPPPPSAWCTQLGPPLFPPFHLFFSAELNRNAMAVPATSLFGSAPIAHPSSRAPMVKPQLALQLSSATSSRFHPLLHADTGACAELASAMSVSCAGSSARDAAVPTTVDRAERCRATAPLPPPRRAAPRVSSLPDHLARRLRPSPPVPHIQTSTCLSGLAAAGNHATTGAPHTMTVVGALMPCPHSQAGLGRVAARLGRCSQTHEAFQPLAMAGRSLGPISDPLLCIPFLIFKIHFCLNNPGNWLH
jgi:hypothetical protein